MSRTSVFTSCTPLPTGITRQSVLDTYHNHTEMIELNPLVVERFRCKPPSYAPAEEFHSTWYTIKDKVSYLPGGLANGSVSYHACFHDLPDGLQTHVYAPLGLDIRAKWTVGGSLPGEPKAPVELGIGAPRDGLYVREDVRMKCNIMMMSFVKKTFKESHAKLVDRLVEKAHILESEAANARLKMLKEVAPGERMGHGSIFIAPPPGYTPSEEHGEYFPGASSQHAQQQSAPQDYQPQQYPDSGTQKKHPQLPIYQEFHQQQRLSDTSSNKSASPHLHHQSLSSTASSNKSNQSPMTSPNLSQASTTISQTSWSPAPLPLFSFSDKPLPSPPSLFQQQQHKRYQHKHTHSEDCGDHRNPNMTFRIANSNSPLHSSLNSPLMQSAGDGSETQTRPRSSTVATARPAEEQQGLALLPATTYSPSPSTTYAAPLAATLTLPATTYLPASTYKARVAEQRSNPANEDERNGRMNLPPTPGPPPPAELPATPVPLGLYPEESPVLGRHMQFAAELPG